MSQRDLDVNEIGLHHPVLCNLDDTETLSEWSKIEDILDPVYAAQTGRLSYPLLTLFRGLLLGIWYRLSDVQLSQALDRDLLCKQVLSVGVKRQRP